MAVPTKITISLPRALAVRVEALRRAEHRTRSGLLQEALRTYFATRVAEAPPAAAGTRALPPGSQGRGGRSPRVARPAAEPPPGPDRERMQMVRRLLEQDRLSQALAGLREAVSRQRAARRAR